MSVNKNILNYLKTKEISQADLAQKMGIAKQNLNRMLHSDDLKVSQLIDLSKSLGVSVTTFFNGKEHISNEEIQGYKRRIDELESALHLEKRHFDSLNKQMKQTSYFIDESIEFILENKKLFDRIEKKDFENFASFIRENIYSRFEYGFSKKKFKSNILFVLNNINILPIEDNSKEFENLFKQNN